MSSINRHVCSESTPGDGSAPEEELDYYEELSVLRHDGVPAYDSKLGEPLVLSDLEERIMEDCDSDAFHYYSLPLGVACALLSLQMQRKGVWLESR